MARVINMLLNDILSPLGGSRDLPWRILDWPCWICPGGSALLDPPLPVTSEVISWKVVLSTRNIGVFSSFDFFCVIIRLICLNLTEKPIFRKTLMVFIHKQILPAAKKDTGKYSFQSCLPFSQSVC